MNSNKYQRCSYCIMDTTDPEITFDNRGRCNHCIKYDAWLEKHLSHPMSLEERTKQMVREIKKSGKNKPYDCIMGLSGGVDSSYLAYYATKELNLRVMAVHVDAGWNSELAVNNIENIVKKLKIDLHTIVIDWEEVRDLQRAFFRSSLPNCDTPQDHAFFAALYKEAIKFNQKHVLTGGNMATESILPTYWGYDAMDWRHIMDVHNKFGEMKLENFPRLKLYEKHIMLPYFYRFKVHRPLELVNYNKDEVKKFLIDELGWRDYGGKHYESTFTKFFQAHYLPEKYGFDKRLAHYSSLIVSGQMTRNEALEEISKPLYDQTELEQDREFFIKKLGFSRDEWDRIMTMEPKTEHDFKNKLVIIKMLKIIRLPISLPIRIAKKIARKFLKLFKA